MAPVTTAPVTMAPVTTAPVPDPHNQVELTPETLGAALHTVANDDAYLGSIVDSLNTTLG
jgi:hypothetical protein